MPEKDVTEKIKNEIRSYIVKKGLSTQKLAELLNEKYGRKESAQNLTNKLNRGSLRYNEVLEIADVLGYKIQWTEKEV